MEESKIYSRLAFGLFILINAFAMYIAAVTKSAVIVQYMLVEAAAVIVAVIPAYLLKARAENTVGGIKHDAVMQGLKKCSTSEETGEDT